VSRSGYWSSALGIALVLIAGSISIASLALRERMVRS